METLDNLPESKPKKKVRLGFKCPFCLQIFANGPSLIDHLRVHNLVTKPESKSIKTGDKNTDVSLPPCFVRLSRCDGRLSIQSRSNSKAKKINGEDNSKNYVQMRSKDRKKLYGCSKCPKKFAQAYEVKRHFRTHTGEKPFVCPNCSRRFAVSGNLKRHVMTAHVKEKRFNCEHCDRRFSLPLSLRRHVRIHTGQKPYICPHCDRRFSQHYNLKCHVRTHTGERPYHCKLCGYKATRKSHLKSHYIRFHKLVNWTP